MLPTSRPLAAKWMEQESRTPQRSSDNDASDDRQGHKEEQGEQVQHVCQDREARVPGTSAAAGPRVGNRPGSAGDVSATPPPRKPTADTQATAAAAAESTGDAVTMTTTIATASPTTLTTTTAAAATPTPASTLGAGALFASVVGPSANALPMKPFSIGSFHSAAAESKASAAPGTSPPLPKTSAWSPSAAAPPPRFSFDLPSPSPQRGAGPAPAATSAGASSPSFPPGTGCESPLRRRRKAASGSSASGSGSPLIGGRATAGTGAGAAANGTPVESRVLKGFASLAVEVRRDVTDPASVRSRVWRGEKRLASQLRAAYAAPKSWPVPTPSMVRDDSTHDSMGTVCTIRAMIFNVVGKAPATMTKRWQQRLEQCIAMSIGSDTWSTLCTLGARMLARHLRLAYHVDVTCEAALAAIDHPANASLAVLASRVAVESGAWEREADRTRIPEASRDCLEAWSHLRVIADNGAVYDLMDASVVRSGMCMMALVHGVLRQEVHVSFGIHDFTPQALTRTPDWLVLKVAFTAGGLSGIVVLHPESCLPVDAVLCADYPDLSARVIRTQAELIGRDHVLLDSVNLSDDDTVTVQAYCLSARRRVVLAAVPSDALDDRDFLEPAVIAPFGPGRFVFASTRVFVVNQFCDGDSTPSLVFSPLDVSPAGSTLVCMLPGRPDQLLVAGWENDVYIVDFRAQTSEVLQLEASVLPGLEMLDLPGDLDNDDEDGGTFVVDVVATTTIAMVVTCNGSLLCIDLASREQLRVTIGVGVLVRGVTLLPDNLVLVSCHLLCPTSLLQASITGAKPQHSHAAIAVFDHTCAPPALVSYMTVGEGIDCAMMPSSLIYDDPAMAASTAPTCQHCLA